MSRSVVIARLGGLGEGVVETPDGPLFIPYALPGEVVEAAIAGNRGFIDRLISPSPERVVAPCRHFTLCGGCAVQHLATDAYAAWKRGLVAEALGRAGIVAPLAGLVDARGTGRRRVTLHVRYDGTGRAMRACAGFMAVRSHSLIDLDACPILVPALARAPAVARAAGEVLKGRAKPLDVQATATLTGIDLDLRGSGPLGDAERLALSELAQAHDLARLTVHGGLVVAPRMPLIAIGRARAVPPPGGFLQATEAGEAALAALVLRAAAGARRIADLFCGVGAFALRLAEQGAVTALDGSEPAIEALRRAAAGTQGLKPISAAARDLFRRPLSTKELAGFEVVVFDPPRAGAEAQARQLALSKVPRVVAVSCDPGTFARDAGILIAGGYRLDSVTPVDQFVYSAHVELVAVFSR